MKRQGDRESPSRMKRARGRSPNRRSYRENSPDYRESRYGGRDARRNISHNRRRSPAHSPRYTPPDAGRSRLGGRDQDDIYNTVSVRNFSSQLSREDIEFCLYEEFRKFGEVTLRVERDSYGERIAYAIFQSSSDAKACKNAKGHLVMHDRRLVIDAVYDYDLPPDRLTSPRYRSPTSRDVRSPRPQSPPVGRSPRRRSPKRNFSRGRAGQRERVPFHDQHSPRERYSPRERLPPSRERSTSRERPPARDRYAYKGRSGSMDGSPAARRSISRGRSESRSPVRDRSRDKSLSTSGSASKDGSVKQSKSDKNANSVAVPPSGGPPPPSFGMGGPFPDPNFFPGPAFMDKPIPPEDDPQATRTLFVGNLEPDVTSHDIRRAFSIFGKIADIDVKRAARGLGSYCFIRFSNLDEAYKAKIMFNGKPVLKNVVRIGYGKVMLSSKVWVGGLGKWTTLSDLEREFDRFGAIRRIDYRRGDTSADILFESIDAAQAACSQMRGFLMPNAEKRLRMDFLDPEPGMPGYDSFLDYGKHDKGHDSNFMHSSNDRYKGNDYRGNSGRHGNRNMFEGDRKHKSDRRSERSRSPRGYRSSPSRTGKYGSSGRNRSPERNSSAVAMPDTAMTEMQYKHFHAKSCYSLHDLCQCFDPPCWQGGFVLKKVAFPVLFFLLDGDMGVFNRTTADPNSPTGRQTMFHFTQRLKLTEDKVAEISKRVNSLPKSNTCLIVAVPGVPENLNLNGTMSGPAPSQHKPLRGLVKYFKEKDAAGIISVPLITLDTPKDPEKLQPSDKKTSGVLHAFPPGAFATEQLLKIGPSLQPQFFADDYLVILLVRGSRSLLV